MNAVVTRYMASTAARTANGAATVPARAELGGTRCRGRSLALALSAACLGAVASAPASAEGPGAPSLRLDGRPIEVRISRVAERTIEVLIGQVEGSGAVSWPGWPAALEDVRREAVWSGRVLDGQVESAMGDLRVRVAATPFSVTLETAGGAAEQTLTWRSFGELRFRAAAPVFGLGQGGGRLDRRGAVQGLGDGYFAGEDTNRIASPLILGADGWALFLPDLADVQDGRTLRRAGLQGEFDLRGPEAVFRRGSSSGPWRVLLSVAADPVELVKELTSVIGRAPMPPRWVLGYLQSHRTLAGWAEVKAVAEGFRERRLPCDGLIYLSEVYCRSGWGNGVTPFAWNPLNFPDPASNLRTLQERGFRVVLHASRYPGGLHGRSVDEGSEDPAHISNYWAQHRELHRLGVDGWWPDDGEDLTAAGRLARHRMYHEGALRERPDERPWALHRTAAPGAARYGGWIWSGDPHSTWKALAAHVPAALNHGLSLTPFWGSDAGGFVPKSDLTGELYVRWFQFAAFSPLFRAHGRNWHLRLPWGWNTGEPGVIENQPVPPPGELRNAAVEPICRRYLELRYQLLPYNYALVREACDTGLPPMRALWLHHPRDPRAVACDDAYLWGRDLLVAPVLERGAAARTIYLPEGTWYDWWTGEALNGGRHVARPVDLGTLPLYVRAGAIVPLDPLRQHTAEAVDGALTLLVHAGADGVFVLYDDDGGSLAYRRGESTRRRLTWDDARRVLRIEAATGGFAWAPDRRDIMVRVRWPDGTMAEKRLPAVGRAEARSVDFQ